jgi:hypothetical protein
MNLSIRLLLITLIINSCSNPVSKKTICTDEQISRFEKCKKNFFSYYSRIKKDYPDQLPDSVKLIYEDIESLSLPELIEKYEAKNSDDIDLFIQSVCVSQEIENAFQKLDEKLKKSDLIIEENKKALDSISAITDKFDFSKIEPGQINLKDLKKAKNGKFYYLKDNKDTVYVKVQIAKYDD